MTDNLRLRDGDQPLPVPNDSPDIQSLVMADIVARRELGIKRYGVALQPHNGRNALLDAYEESLDQTMYLKQALVESGGPAVAAYASTMEELARLRLALGRNVLMRERFRVERHKRKLLRHKLKFVRLENQRLHKMLKAQRAELDAQADAVSNLSPGAPALPAEAKVVHKRFLDAQGEVASESFYLIGPRRDTLFQAKQDLLGLMMAQYSMAPPRAPDTSPAEEDAPSPEPEPLPASSSGGVDTIR